MATPTVGRPPANSKTLKTSSGNSTRSRGYDPRGSSKDRRARKNWMLSSPQFGHDATHHEQPNVLCAHCGQPQTFKTVESDKKEPSLGYRRENIQPSCRNCNIMRSNNPNWVHPSKVGE